MTKGETVSRGVYSIILCTLLIFVTLSVSVVFWERNDLAQIRKLFIRSGEEKEVKKYNIVLIIADDLGWADVSWNNEKVKVNSQSKKYI